MTHSLLSSWLYALKENPYEDATTTSDPMSDFMSALRRESTPTTEAMQKGIDFENLVTAILAGKGDTENKWYSAARLAADVVRGSVAQYRARREVEVGGHKLLLYGRLDWLKAGTIIDTKFSGSYDRGKYFNSTQHPVYLELVPEAKAFTYLISNGTELWTETYTRDETPDIYPVISDFMDWLRVMGLLDLYKDKWLAL